MNSADAYWNNTAERARLSFLLLDLWEDLDAILAYATQRPRPSNLRPVPDWVMRAASALPEETPRDVLRRWATVFSDELDLVRRTRNSVAHSIDLPDHTLRSAAHTAAKLLLFARLSAAAPGETEDDIEFTDARLAAALHAGPGNQATA